MAEPKYQLRGALTRRQAQQIAELLAGGSVLWDRGHTFPCDGIEIAPESAPEGSQAWMEEPEALTGYAEKQLDAIDASVFSGDTYDNDEGRARLAWYMGRWCRELVLVPGVQPIPREDEST